MLCRIIFLLLIVGSVSSGEEFSKRILVVKNQYKLYAYENGKLKSTYEIALSQNPIGHKEREGDRRLPEGEYWICEKFRGPFGKDPWWYEFLGSAWLRINYPNQDDAVAAFKKKLLSQDEYDAILAANQQRRIPPQKTALGGGIGIHGWTEPGWSDDGNRNLTWGCISMHNSDLELFYNWADLYTPVRIVK